MSTPHRSFEEALSELEARVRRLEVGDLELDEALEIFEEGIGLVRECHEQLDEDAPPPSPARSMPKRDDPIG
jgi:exodeoxyribonuclease VII small subunit